MDIRRHPEELDRPAWRVLLVLRHNPDRDTATTIADALPGVPMHADDVAQLLTNLRAQGYVAELDGRWSLTPWCRKAFEEDFVGGASGTPTRPQGGAAHRSVLSRVLRRGTKKDLSA
jgi:hypothetical protein